jgi:hypothetical protein
MPIDRRCRLRTAVAVHAFEIDGGHPMLAEGAFERRAAIHQFSCVISHIFNGSPYYLPGHWGNRCATFEQDTCVTTEMVNEWFLPSMPKSALSVRSSGFSKPCIVDH